MLDLRGRTFDVDRCSIHISWNGEGCCVCTQLLVFSVVDPVLLIKYQVDFVRRIVPGFVCLCFGGSAGRSGTSSSESSDSPSGAASGRVGCDGCTGFALGIGSFLFLSFGTVFGLCCDCSAITPQTPRRQSRSRPRRRMPGHRNDRRG